MIFFVLNNIYFQSNNKYLLLFKIYELIYNTLVKN